MGVDRVNKDQDDNLRNLIGGLAREVGAVLDRGGHDNVAVCTGVLGLVVVSQFMSYDDESMRHEIWNLWVAVVEKELFACAGKRQH